MNNKTFGIVVGVIIALALAMFAGLYMLGLSVNNTDSAFNDGYEYEYENSTIFYPDVTEDAQYYYDDSIEYLEDEFYFDESITDENIFYDEEGNAYNFDDYETFGGEFEEFDFEELDELNYEPFITE